MGVANQSGSIPRVFSELRRCARSSGLPVAHRSVRHARVTRNPPRPAARVLPQIARLPPLTGHQVGAHCAPNGPVDTPAVDSDRGIPPRWHRRRNRVLTTGRCPARRTTFESGTPALFRFVLIPLLVGCGPGARVSGPLLACFRHHCRTPGTGAQQRSSALIGFRNGASRDTRAPREAEVPGRTVPARAVPAPRRAKRRKPGSRCWCRCSRAFAPRRGRTAFQRRR